METKLVLEDFSEYKGTSIGHDSSITGEVVFNTGMVGYPQTFTDPSYKGQILVLTYPLIGNYGVPSQEKGQNGLMKHFESDKIHISGLIIDDYSKNDNHWNSIKNLSSWLKEQKIPALCGIDTRALTKKLRQKGVMLGKIIIGQDIKIQDPNALDLVSEVTIKEPIAYSCFENSIKNVPHKIILIDCGCKNNIIRELLKRNTTIKRVPYDYDFSAEDYDGLFISNGPGDPKMCTKTILHIKKAMQIGKPIFGICLGNQLLALASGADTYKLKFGHRSQNQPCTEEGTKRCYITSQNHGYAVNTKTLSEEWEPWFTNANDETNEGIKHKTNPFMGVQFHPEATPGPVDTNFLFDKFIDMIEKHKKER